MNATDHPTAAAATHNKSNAALPLSKLHLFLHKSIPHFQHRHKKLAQRLQQLGATVTTDEASRGITHIIFTPEALLPAAAAAEAAAVAAAVDAGSSTAGQQPAGASSVPHAPRSSTTLLAPGAVPATQLGVLMPAVAAGQVQDAAVVVPEDIMCMLRATRQRALRAAAAAMPASPAPPAAAAPTPAAQQGCASARGGAAQHVAVDAAGAAPELRSSRAAEAAEAPAGSQEEEREQQQQQQGSSSSSGLHHTWDHAASSSDSEGEAASRPIKARRLPGELASCAWQPPAGSSMHRVQMPCMH